MKKLIAIFLLLSVSVSFAQDKTGLAGEVRKKVAGISNELVQIRRQIHMNPELGNREFKTSALVAEELRKAGIDVTEKVAHTGVVGILHGKKSGRVVAVRADMDALPIQELTDLPFKSRVDGVMHACGHDMHTTILIGTARVLAGLKANFDGTVKFLFQPAEEGAPSGEKGGADYMIEEGVLGNPAPEVIFGLHMSAGDEVGTISYTPAGALASSDGFRIVIKGKGTHAAYPWEGKDPIVTASHVVLGLQNIRSRMTDTRKPIVVSIGMIRGGNRSNIIPEEVQLVGTVRTHDPQMRRNAKVLMEQIIAGICESYGCEYTFGYRFGAPVTYNNVKLTKWAVNIFEDLYGKERIVESSPHMGAEDFAYYGQQIPACFYFLGGGNKAKGYTYPGHNPHYAVDEDAITMGVESMVSLVLNFLKSKETF